MSSLQLCWEGRCIGLLCQYGTAIVGRDALKICDSTNNYNQINNKWLGIMMIIAPLMRIIMIMTIMGKVIIINDNNNKTSYKLTTQ